MADDEEQIPEGEAAAPAEAPESGEAEAPPPSPSPAEAPEEAPADHSTTEPDSGAPDGGPDGGAPDGGSGNGDGERKIIYAKGLKRYWENRSQLDCPNIIDAFQDLARRVGSIRILEIIPSVDSDDPSARARPVW